jgi:hypothetical protein
MIVAVATMVTAPASADHNYRKWTAGSTVTWEDRTGTSDMRVGLRTAVEKWNAAGANITIVYSEGPADNQCPTTTGVVYFCTGALNGGAYAYSYPAGGYDITAGHVMIDANATWSGFGQMHEGGHMLGLAHSCQYSVMYMRGNWPGPSCGGVVDWSLQASEPTAHDKEVLLATYGPRPTPPRTTQGKAWWTNTSADTPITVTSGSTVSAYATGAQSRIEYKLVSGRDVGRGPCSEDPQPINPNVQRAYSSGGYFGDGYIPPASGPLNRPAGQWQVCFQQSVTVTQPLTVIVT